MEWFIKTFPEFSAVSVPRLEAYRSSLATIPTYRLLPQDQKGAGAFCALLRRSSLEDRPHRESSESVSTRLRAAWRSPTLFVSRPTAAGQGESRRNRRHNEASKRAPKYERQKIKRMLRDYE